MKTPNLREFRPDAGDAKDVEDTKMLDTTAREMNQYESNEVGKERVVTHGSFGPLGMTGRN